MWRERTVGDLHAPFGWIWMTGQWQGEGEGRVVCQAGGGLGDSRDRNADDGCIEQGWMGWVDGRGRGLLRLRLADVLAGPGNVGRAGGQTRRASHSRAQGCRCYTGARANRLLQLRPRVGNPD